MTIETLSKYYDKAPKEYASLREKIAAEKRERELRYTRFKDIWEHAIREGDKAAKAHTPTPMIVQEHTNMIDDLSPVKQEWHVPDGVCGFASIHLSDGRCSFTKWAKKNAGFSKDYRKGLSHWVSDYRQSMERKAKFASTVARILNDNGIDAYSTSRMD